MGIPNAIHASKVLALPVATLLASGCGGPAKSYATQDLTGNWQFFQIDAFNIPNPITVLTGALSGQGETITGVFRAGGCISSMSRAEQFPPMSSRADICFTFYPETRTYPTLRPFANRRRVASLQCWKPSHSALRIVTQKWPSEH